MSDDAQENSVDSIIEQLKQVPKIVNEVRESIDPLTKENLEEFILKHTGRLVTQATESVTLVKDYVETAPNAEDVTALAELIRATSSAVESLNRILITDKRSNNAVKIKQMELDSRQQQFDTAVGVKIMLTREELLQQLISPKSQTIDITTENVLDVVDPTVPR